MRVLKKIWYGLDKWVAQGCYIYILITLFFQTMFRYLFNRAAAWPEEFATYTMVWLAYMSASFAVQSNSHLRIDSVMLVWPKGLRKYVDIAANLLWIFIAVALAVFGFQYTAQQFAKNATAVAINWMPMGIFYLGIPVGHVILCLRLLEDTVRKTIAIKRGEADSGEVVIASTETG